MEPPSRYGVAAEIARWARAKPAGERPRAVRERCGGDDVLREIVQRLLETEDAATLVGAPCPSEGERGAKSAESGQSKRGGNGRAASRAGPRSAIICAAGAHSSVG